MSEQVPWHRVVSTWPRRVAALAASAAVGWVVTQTLPGLWPETSGRVGLAPAPLAVSVVQDIDTFHTLDDLFNPEYVIPKPIRELGLPPNGFERSGRHHWAKSLGGIDADQTVLRLVLRGRADEPVVIQGLELERVSVGRPRSGTLVTYLTGGDDHGIAVRYFDIGLDANPVRIRYVPESGSRGVRFPYRVSSTDLEIFDIHASTELSDVKWRLRLHYSAAGGDGTITIDDHGRPFETTAVATERDWRARHERGPAPQRAFYVAGDRWVAM
jgi:hypothetical protein